MNLIDQPQDMTELAKDVSIEFGVGGSFGESRVQNHGRLTRGDCQGIRSEVRPVPCPLLVRDADLGIRTLGGLELEVGAVDPLPGNFQYSLLELRFGIQEIDLH